MSWHDRDKVRFGEYLKNWSERGREVTQFVILEVILRHRRKKQEYPSQDSWLQVEVRTEHFQDNVHRWHRLSPSFSTIKIFTGFLTLRVYIYNFSYFESFALLGY
jgi:hypothetical protein